MLQARASRLDLGTDLGGDDPKPRIQNLLPPCGRQREVARRMRRMPTVRFGRETSLLVLELRQEGGRGIHINMEGRGDQAQFELGATFDLPAFSHTDPEAVAQLAAAKIGRAHV